tara:strand:- start:63668 stop:64036 length:369 start_codon:yes stop_codon:yes gene_type:complete
MSQDTNLPLINPVDNFDQRVQDYFTNYFTNQISMTDNEFEAAKSFFIARTKNPDAAAALTAAVIEAANELNINIIDIIKEFDDSNLKSAIPTFLNLSRRTSSLLGYEQNIKPNENIARQVEA